MKISKMLDKLRERERERELHFRETKVIKLIEIVININMILILTGITIVKLTGNKLLEKTELLASEMDNIEFYYKKLKNDRGKIDILIIVKDENNGIKEIEYPNGDILNCNGKNEIGIDFVIDRNEEYIFKITSNSGYMKEEVICEELKKQWNLGVQHEEFQTYKGTPEYNGLEEGLYLKNSIVSTKEKLVLNKYYTIMIEAKNIENNGWGFMLATGQRRISCWISILGNL